MVYTTYANRIDTLYTSCVHYNVGSDVLKLTRKSFFIGKHIEMNAKEPTYKRLTKTKQSQALKRYKLGITKH